MSIVPAVNVPVERIRVGEDRQREDSRPPGSLTERLRRRTRGRRRRRRRLLVRAVVSLSFIGVPLVRCFGTAGRAGGPVGAGTLGVGPSERGQGFRGTGRVAQIHSTASSNGPCRGTLHGTRGPVGPVPWSHGTGATSRRAPAARPGTVPGAVRPTPARRAANSYVPGRGRPVVPRSVGRARRGPP